MATARKAHVGSKLALVAVFIFSLAKDTPTHAAGGESRQKCCEKLQIEGTLNRDPWYQDMMGVFTIYPELPWIEYENRGDISGRYPVYVHNLSNFVATPERPVPPKVFLYYYFNEVPEYPEVECKDRGCWIISMYDATPGNYWFGKKWYHIKTKPSPKCPDDLTTTGGRFINQKGDIDPGLVIRCLKDASTGKEEL